MYTNFRNIYYSTVHTDWWSFLLNTVKPLKPNIANIVYLGKSPIRSPSQSMTSTVTYTSFQQRRYSLFGTGFAKMLAGATPKVNLCQVWIRLHTLALKPRGDVTQKSKTGVSVLFDNPYRLINPRFRNKIAFQWDAYRPLVDHIPACTGRGGVSAWGGGVCQGDVCRGGVCIGGLPGVEVSARGCLPGGVCPGGVCPAVSAQGCLPRGYVCQGVCLPEG